MARSIDMGLGRRIDAWAGLLLCALLYGFARVRARLGGPALPRWGAPTPPQPEAPPLRPRRVLAIKLWGLGNLVMIVPILDALRRAAPGVEIDFLTLEANRPLLTRSGVVERVFGFEVRSYAALARSLWAALRALRARRYDLVIDFEQFAKLSAIAAYASGAPRRVGFDTDGQRRGALYTSRVAYADGEHMRQVFLRLLRPLGIEASLRPPSFAIEPAERARARELLAAAGVAGDHFPIVALHVGSGPSSTGVPLKRWPVESFAALADALVLRHGAAVVFTGHGDEERGLVREAVERMRQPAIDACGRLGLGDLLALLEACDFVVSNDTSVMHLANAVGTPVAALFGPTSPQQYGPWNPGDLVFWQGLFCSPCLTNYNQKVSTCADPVCIRSIPPAQVLEAVEKRFLGPDAGRRRRSRESP
jgi:lipopolysaccharide heptosyltransferase II